MNSKFIEATNMFNWGKFMLSRFTDEEWARRSKIDEGAPLLGGRGWTRQHVFVFDLQTGEGAFFMPSKGGTATYDLEKHQIWVCPMFQPFINWLYEQDLDDLSKLPDVVELVGESAFYGHRRKGPDPETKKAVISEIEVFKCMCEPHKCDCGHLVHTDKGMPTQCPVCGRPVLENGNQI